MDEEINTQLKDAMRAKDQLKLDTLRSIKSAFKYKMVEKKTDELSQAEALEVLQSLAKQRKDSTEQYQNSGRAEAAEKEKKELEIISSFLPAALSEEEVKRLIEESIQKVGAETAKDMGKVMKDLRPQVIGRVDNKQLSELVRQRLS